MYFAILHTSFALNLSIYPSVYKLWIFYNCKCLCILLPYIDRVYNIVYIRTYVCVCVYLRRCVRTHVVLSRNKFSHTYKVSSSILHTVPSEEQICSLINFSTYEFGRALHLKETSSSSEVPWYITLGVKQTF